MMAGIKESQYYSRPNRFIVEIVPPSTLMQVVGDKAMRRLSFNAKSATLPGRSIEAGSVRYSGGYEHKKAIHSTYSDLEVSFYLSEDLIEKEVMDAWQSLIFDPNYQISSYPDDYYGSVIVTKYTVGKGNAPIASYTYHNAWPMNVQDVAQDWDSSSQIDVLPVQFSYHRWSKG
jgi:hypothetical protein